MKSVEAVGKNIEQAIENALFELKATREDVDIKIISEGGLFRKAKVSVSISEEAIEKYEKKAEKRKKVLEDEDGLLIKKNAEEVKAEKEQIKEVKKEEKQKEKEEKKAEKEEVKHEKKDKKVIDPEEFLNGFIKAYNKDCKLEKIEDDENITYLIKGEDVGDLIGYRGESLFALSYLTSVIAGKTEKRVLVDVEGYREKRKQALESLANKIASKVAKTGRYAKLDPMDPAERRIVHLALQDNDKVTTLSKGTEPHRFIIVFPREYDENK